VDVTVGATTVGLRDVAQQTAQRIEPALKVGMGEIGLGGLGHSYSVAARPAGVQSQLMSCFRAGPVGGRRAQAVSLLPFSPLALKIDSLPSTTPAVTR